MHDCCSIQMLLRQYTKQLYCVKLAIWPKVCYPSAPGIYTWYACESLTKITLLHVYTTLAETWGTLAMGVGKYASCKTQLFYTVTQHHLCMMKLQKKNTAYVHSNPNFLRGMLRQFQAIVDSNPNFLGGVWRQSKLSRRLCGGNPNFLGGYVEAIQIF